jgi:hypothetical protein
LGPKVIVSLSENNKFSNFHVNVQTISENFMMENESEESVCHFCDKCSATFDNAMALSRHKVQNHFHQTLQASNRFKGGRSQQNYSNNELFQVKNII